MQQRKSGRPSGTDGYDFSYRMVVDSRYTKVAKGKSRLCTLILTQAVTQWIGGLCVVLLSISKEKDVNKLAVSSTVIGFLSLVIGELGRRRSRVSLLRVYIITSSIALLLSVYVATTTNSTLEVLRNLSDWERNKFELIETLLLLLGSLLQIFTISTVISLICNMSPPKKAS